MRFLPLAAAAVVLGTSLPARANPRPFPFTYIYETEAEGEAEVEQYADVAPLRALSTVGSNQGKKAWYAQTQFQTEYEHGLTDRLELGLYVVVVPTPGESYTQTATTFEATGVKQRLKYRFADAGAWPVDLALYGELVETQRNFEVEAKIILQRRVGPVRVAANVVGEREFYYDGAREWEFFPSAGVTVPVDATFQPGIEWWMIAEWQDQFHGPRVYNLGPNHFVGPTVLLQFNKFWWSTGVYLHANELDHTIVPGDAYGHVWARTVVGFGL